MRRISLMLLLCLLAAPAWATPPAEDPAAPQVAPAETPTAAAADTKDADKADATKRHDRNCLRHTGSRIPRKDRNGCLPVSGRSYDSEDLQRTGANNLAEALERLDPSIRRY